jgi:STE24 endopeptidase
MASRIWFLLGTAVILIMTALLVGTFVKIPPSASVLHYFDRSFLVQAANYQHTNILIFIIKQFIVWGFLIGVAFYFWKHIRVAPKLSLPLVAGYVAVIFILIYLLTLPLEYYQGFILEHRFGFSVQSPGSWFLDYVKNKTISLAISVFIFTGLFALMRYFPTRWWWLGGITFTVFLVITTYFYPLVIDPLFYKFEPLKNKEMTTSILQMAEKAGIKIDEVLVANASARTRKVNAYFTGLGKTKRIVLYDNLLSQFPPKETLAVVAHEMGHWNHSHLIKGTFLGIFGVFLALFLLKLILGGMQLELKADYRTIILVILFFSLFSFVSLPFQNAISRFWEKEADLEAMRLTEDPLTHITLKQNLALANLAEVDPHPFVKYIIYTHPSTMDRIKLAVQEAKKQETRDKTKDRE